MSTSSTWRNPTCAQRRPGSRNLSASTRAGRHPRGATTYSARGEMGLQRTAGTTRFPRWSMTSHRPCMTSSTRWGTSARARSAHRHGGPARRTTSATSGSTTTRAAHVRPVGQRPRLHRRLQHRLPARQVRPGSDAGQTMLAHELTHVVQQRSGPVDGTPTPAASRSATRPTASSGSCRERGAGDVGASLCRARYHPAPPRPVQRDVDEAHPVQRDETPPRKKRRRPPRAPSSSAWRPRARTRRRRRRLTPRESESVGRTEPGSR